MYRGHLRLVSTILVTSLALSNIQIQSVRAESQENTLDSVEDLGESDAELENEINNSSDLDLENENTTIEGETKESTSEQNEISDDTLVESNNSDDNTSEQSESLENDSESSEEQSISTQDNQNIEESTDEEIQTIVIDWRDYNKKIDGWLNKYENESLDPVTNDDVTSEDSFKLVATLDPSVLYSSIGSVSLASTSLLKEYSDDTDSESVDNDTSLEEIKAKYTKSSTYTISIPKTISGKTEKESYSISVSGDLLANQTLEIKAKDQDDSDDNIGTIKLTEVNGEKEDAILNNLSYKTKVTKGDLSDSEVVNLEQVLKTISISAGNWEGKIEWDIELQTDENYEPIYQSEVYKNATCTSEGIMVYYSDCGTYYTEVIPIKEHEYEETIVEPQDYEGGYTIHKCVNCGDTYIDNYTEQLVQPEELNSSNTKALDVCYSETQGYYPEIQFNGVTLEKGVDYRITSSVSENCGDCTIAIEGLNKYTGEVELSYKLFLYEVFVGNYKFRFKEYANTWEVTKSIGKVMGCTIHYYYVENQEVWDDKTQYMITMDTPENSGYCVIDDGDFGDGYSCHRLYYFKNTIENDYTAEGWNWFSSTGGYTSESYESSDILMEYLEN